MQNYSRCNSEFDIVESSGEKKIQMPSPEPTKKCKECGIYKEIHEKIKSHEFME